MIGEFERFFDHASAGVANAFAHPPHFFLGPCGAEVEVSLEQPVFLLL